MTTARRRLIREAGRVNPVAPIHIWRTPPGTVDMVIVTHVSVYAVVHEHAREALPNETGGFLIGRVGRDDRQGCWHLEIEEALPVEPVSQNPTHFAFTWRDVDRIRSYREEHGKALLGWYHTHPDLPIFLSETDLERTHRVLFSEPFQIALVYDPVRSCAGYFFWEGAQKVDATRATWREFEIAVRDEPDSDDTPPNGLPALATPAAPASADPEEKATLSTPESSDVRSETSVAPPTADASAPADAPPDAAAQPAAAASVPPPEPDDSDTRPHTIPRPTSEDTQSRLRLPSDAQHDGSITASRRPVRTQKPQSVDSFNDTAVLTSRRIDAPTVPRSRRMLGLLIAVLVLAGLVSFAYFWLAPPAG